MADIHLQNVIQHSTVVRRRVSAEHLLDGVGGPVGGTEQVAADALPQAAADEHFLSTDPHRRRHAFGALFQESHALRRSDHGTVGTHIAARRSLNDRKHCNEITKGSLGLTPRGPTAMKRGI